VNTVKVNCACVRCLQCGRTVPAHEVTEDGQLLVSVQLAEGVSFDAVLLVHAECVEDAYADVELLNVKALGRALMLATECAVRRKLERVERPGAGAEPQVKRPKAKAARR
jgi:hypothetical protein